MTFTPRVSHIRKQLEIAQLLAKSHVGFVIFPIRTEEEYHAGLIEQARRIDKLSQAAEAEQNGGCDGG